MAVTPLSNMTRKFEWHNGTALVQIKGLDEINIQEGERSLIDASDLDTALNVAQPQIVGLRGMTIITIIGKFDADDTDQAAFRADFIAGTVRNCKVTRSDATPSTKAWAQAVVRTFEEPGSKSDKAQFTATIAAWGTETLA